MTTELPEHMDNPNDLGPLALVSSEGLGLPVAAYDAGGEVRIEAAKQMDGRVLWRVREHGNVLAKTGEWEWEPMPSGRDDEFLARCRFDTPQEALACLRGAKW